MGDGVGAHLGTDRAGPGPQRGDDLGALLATEPHDVRQVTQGRQPELLAEVVQGLPRGLAGPAGAGEFLADADEHPGVADGGGDLQGLAGTGAGLAFHRDQFDVGTQRAAELGPRLGRSVADVEIWQEPQPGRDRDRGADRDRDRQAQPGEAEHPGQCRNGDQPDERDESLLAVELAHRLAQDLQVAQRRHPPQRGREVAQRPVADPLRTRGRGLDGFAGASRGEQPVEAIDDVDTGGDQVPDDAHHTGSHQGSGDRDDPDTVHGRACLTDNPRNLGSGLGVARRRIQRRVRAYRPSRQARAICPIGLE